MTKSICITFKTRLIYKTFTCMLATVTIWSGVRPNVQTQLKVGWAQMYFTAVL